MEQIPKQDELLEFFQKSLEEEFTETRLAEKLRDLESEIRRTNFFIEKDSKLVALAYALDEFQQYDIRNFGSNSSNTSGFVLLKDTDIRDFLTFAVMKYVAQQILLRFSNTDDKRFKVDLQHRYPIEELVKSIDKSKNLQTRLTLSRQSGEFFLFFSGIYWESLDERGINPQDYVRYSGKFFEQAFVYQSRKKGRIASPVFMALYRLTDDIVCAMRNAKKKHMMDYFPEVNNLLELQSCMVRSYSNDLTLQ